MALFSPRITQAASVAPYVRQTDFPWPILIDALRSLYHAYGMEAGRGGTLGLL